MPITPRTRIPTILYFVIRLSMLAYCLGRAVLLTLPITDCGRLAQVLNALLTINVICLTGLCYLRITIVYSENRCVVVFFGLTWLSVRDHPGPFGVPALAALALNDTLIYFAIAYRIYNIFLTYDFGMMHLERKLAVIAFGASLPTVGQLYCLIIVISKACVLIVVSIDEDKNFVFLIAHLVLTTILVSRVYRELIQITYPNQRDRMEFGSGNLTSAEFVPHCSTSTLQTLSKRPTELQGSMIAVPGSSRQTETSLDVTAT
ncbi:hypothetical protein BJ912DRAFT_974113 [Pholiota molesta]|nr:hypothetical protein BJ912DRAFT_974113 [Pholiota molesta]